MSLLLLFLPFVLTLVYVANLQYSRTNLFDSPQNVTLTDGATTQRVYCVQGTGPVPTSMVWYNPQGQLVSKDSSNDVNQATAGGGRIAHLNFHSYQQSQGRKYECRVASPGNNTERLSVSVTPFY